MAEPNDRIEVTLGAQGRLVIPASLRKAARFNPGDVLVIRQEEDRIVLEPARSIERRLLKRFSALPKSVDLVAELIAERRAAAAREAAE